MAFGRLERNPGSQPMSEINMTPLIDVMLVLLVIFIITAPLMASSLKLDLPKAEAGAPSSAPAFVALAIDAQGQLFLGDAPLSAATAAPLAGTLEAAGQLESQLTRRLRDALHHGLAHLQFGQVLLASIGSTAPFVGLFGTVWGIYHALAGISAAGSLSIDKVSGPIGEALIMTAAGIAVAVPAVLAFNIFGKWVAACEGELEGFAHDLRQMILDSQAKS